MIKYTFILCVATVCLCAGCGSSVKIVRAEGSPDFQLSRYKTFDFYKLEGSGDTSSYFTPNARMMQEAIARELAARGLSQTSQQPDLLVNIGVVVEEKVQTRETTFRDAPRYVGTRSYHWESQEIEVNRYKVGSVVVELVDRPQNQLVWQGVAESVVPAKQEKIRERIQEGVEALFEKMKL